MRRYRVYDADSERLLGYVNQGLYEQFIAELRVANDPCGLDGLRYGFPGRRIAISEATAEVGEQRRDERERLARAVVITLDNNHAWLRPPKRATAFNRELRRTVPEATWVSPAGWQLPADRIMDAVEMLPSHFHGSTLVLRTKTGQVLRELELRHLGPEPRAYTRPPEDCERLKLRFSHAQLRHLLQSGQVVVHRSVGTVIDPEIVDTSSKQFWRGGWGYDLADSYGQIGERRWVAEKFAPVQGTTLFAYAADYQHRGHPPGVLEWLDYRLMERGQARMVVALSGVTIHQLQTLPEEDYQGNKVAFARRWDSTSKFEWAGNPWVWRLAFVRLLPKPET